MKKILIVNPFGIGDALFSVYVAQALLDEFPGSEIGFLCNERTSGLIRMIPYFRAVHEFNRDQLRALRKKSLKAYLLSYQKIIQEIASYGYEAVLDYSLGREFGFMCWAAGIKRRIGFDYRNRGLFLNKKIKIEGYEDESVASAQFALTRFLGIEKPLTSRPIAFKIPDECSRAADHFFGLEALGSADKIMVLSPGGGKSWGKNAVYKQWDPEKFAIVANQWAGGRLDRGVVLMGDDSDKAVISDTLSRLTAPFQAAVSLPIGVAAAILKKAEFFLGNDGGLMHLANALGVRTVSIFGPVDPVVYGPHPNQTLRSVVTHPVSCRPCYRNFFFPPCSHNRQCLSQISADEVLGAIKKIT